METNNTVENPEVVIDEERVTVLPILAGIGLVGTGIFGVTKAVKFIKKKVKERKESKTEPLEETAEETK